MFRRQKPVVKPVEQPALVFSPTCDVPGCLGKAGHHHEWELGNAGRFHKFYCPKHWEARQERLKKTQNVRNDHAV